MITARGIAAQSAGYATVASHARMSAAGYPNLASMNATSASARAAGASNARTYPESVARNGVSADAGARVGCAAISQDGQGVGTEPICDGDARDEKSGNQVRGREEGVWRTNRHSPASTKGLVVNHSHMNALVVPSFTESIRPRMSLLTAPVRG